MEDAPRTSLSLRRLLAGWSLVAATLPGLGLYADDADSLDASGSPWLLPIENLDPVFAVSDPATADIEGESRNIEPVRMFHAIREPAQRSVAIREPHPDRLSPTAARVRANGEPTVAVITEPKFNPAIPSPAIPSPAITVQAFRPQEAAASNPSPQRIPPLPATATVTQDLPPSLLHAPVMRPPAAVATWQDTAEQTRWQRRQTIAHQVSTEILDDAPEVHSQPPQLNVSTFTARRLAQQAAQLLREAREQAKRGTPLSAHNSAMETLRLVADANDLLDGTVTSATNLLQAQTALRESADFSGRFGPVGPDAISRMVQSHQTPVLKNCDPGTLNGSRAADIYLNFAREQFAAVALANPLATEALMVLAEVQQQSDTPDPVNDAIVISLLRAALQAQTDNAVIANELGYQLLKQGLLSEAKWVLEHSFHLQPSRAAGTNLAEVMRQQGDLAGARYLIARLDRLPAPQIPQPRVYSVSPQQFAAMSPAMATPVTPAQGHPQTVSQTNGQGISPVVNSASPTVAPAQRYAAPIQPTEPKSPVGRVADAVSRLWK